MTKKSLLVLLFCCWTFTSYSSGQRVIFGLSRAESRRYNQIKNELMGKISVSVEPEENSVLIGDFSFKVAVKLVNLSSKDLTIPAYSNYPNDLIPLLAYTLKYVDKPEIFGNHGGQMNWLSNNIVLKAKDSIMFTYTGLPGPITENKEFWMPGRVVLNVYGPAYEGRSGLVAVEPIRAIQQLTVGQYCCWINMVGGKYGIYCVGSDLSDEIKKLSLDTSSQEIQFNVTRLLVTKKQIKIINITEEEGKWYISYQPVRNGFLEYFSSLDRTKIEIK
jgi:hypothetical protein